MLEGLSLVSGNVGASKKMLKAAVELPPLPGAINRAVIPVTVKAKKSEKLNELDQLEKGEEEEAEEDQKRSLPPPDCDSSVE